MRHTKLLSIILVFAAGLYLYKLGDNPPGLYADEASTGYNAYTLFKTGKDEYGKFLPFGFRQLGSYTPPLYIYLTAPIVGIFGLSPFSTRFISVLCGLGVITIFFYLLQLFEICKSKTSLFVTTLLFATTPWLLFFSRMGYEQNLALFLFSLSILLFTKSLSNPKLILLTIPVMSLTTYADFPMRYLMPLTFVVLAFAFWKKLEIAKFKNVIILGALIAAIIQIPNLYLATTKSFYYKQGHFYADTIQTQAEKIDLYLPHSLSIPLAFTRELFAQYSEYFSPRSLFFEGDPDLQRSIPELSVFYPWTIVLYLIGFFILFRQKNSDTRKILLILLFITPLTGAFTKQPFHVQRTLAFMLPISMIMGLTIDFVFKKLGTLKSVLIFSVLLFLSLIHLWRSYFVLLPQLRYATWGSQWKILAEYIKAHPNDHFVIDQVMYQRPEEIAYFQLALYLKTDPKIIQESSDPKVLMNYYNDVDFNPSRSFQNMEMKPIDWGETVHTEQIIIGNLTAISDNEITLHNLTQVLEIKDPTNNVILRGFRTNPK